MDGESHQVVLEYQDNELSVYVVDSPSLDSSPPVLLLRTQINLSDYVKLDNGCGYLGFAQETNRMANIVMLENWRFQSNLSTN